MKLFRSYNFPVVKEAVTLLGRRKWIFLIFVCGFFAVEIISGALFAAGLRGVTNALSDFDRRALISSVILAASGIFIWWIYVPVSAYMCDLATKGAVQRLKSSIFVNMLLMPLSEHEKRSGGELLSALTNDLACLQRIYDYDFAEVGRNLLGGIAGIILMAVIDLRFTAVALILGGLSIYISAFFNKRLEKSGQEQQEALAKSTDEFYELIKGAKTLRLLRLQSHVYEKVSSAVQKEADTKIKSGRTASRMRAYTAAVSALGYCVILFAGALLVHFKLTDWGSVVALMWLKASSADMLFIDFGQRMAGMQVSIAGVKRLLKMREVPAEADPENVSIEPSENALVFENITFDYRGDKVLEDYSFVLPKSGITALVGESGAGKSTVIKLALGLYAPKSGKGKIVFDGTEVLTLKNIRMKTAYVPQEPLLFRGSIVENILLGNQNADREDAVEAARMAGADSFISEMEKGYDTLLTDDGKNLSGGQKQKIALARALIKNAPILLLDEITSALDKASEEKILETLRLISRSKAILMVTHDADVTGVADRVISICRKTKETDK